MCRAYILTTPAPSASYGPAHFPFAFEIILKRDLLELGPDQAAQRHHEKGHA